VTPDVNPVTARRALVVLRTVRPMTEDEDRNLLRFMVEIAGEDVADPGEIAMLRAYDRAEETRRQENLVRTAKVAAEVELAERAGRERARREAREEADRHLAAAKAAEARAAGIS